MIELEKLINFIIKKYDEINLEWEKNENYNQLNMKKIQVADVYIDKEKLNYIFNYRNFINDKFPYIFSELQQIGFLSNVTSRVKALNSIQYKIENYKLNHEDGKIPLKKSLNDLLGFRIVLLNDIDYNSVKSYIKDIFPSLKCIKSTKKEYDAVHIYFGNENNKKFQWELQLWNKSKEKTNLKSHAEYKQDYTKWESRNNKGGV